MPIAYRAELESVEYIFVDHAFLKELLEELASLGDTGAWYERLHSIILSPIPEKDWSTKDSRWSALVRLNKEAKDG